MYFETGQAVRFRPNAHHGLDQTDLCEAFVALLRSRRLTRLLNSTPWSAFIQGPEYLISTQKENSSAAGWEVIFCGKLLATAVAASLLHQPREADQK